MVESESKVLIVGGGPAGLVTAIELGRRNVPCILFDLNPDPPKFPKANSTTSRTMEHYRRLGLAEEMRAHGLPGDYAPDISYHTTFTGYELARRRWKPWDEIAAERTVPDPRWPTPEPMNRGQQMFVEAVLRRHVATLASVDLRFGWRVETVAERSDGVSLEAVDLGSGERALFRADYAVGCDAARSVVRKTMGVDYEGIGEEDREFLGGKMLATYLDMPGFYDLCPFERSWQYWSMNPRRFGALVAIDGRGRFVLHTQLPRGQEATLDYARQSVELTTGRSFDFRIIDIAEWNAGFMLVAERFGSDRLFLAGDAAHLFTPTSGLGYNTSVDDASNLGWKLAAVCQGWGGAELLASYSAERRPIAQRNTRFARQIAEYFRSISIPEALEETTPTGESARAEFGQWLDGVGEREFDTPGIHFGVFYDQSSIVVPEPGPAPPDDPHWYEPHARPGARAPHHWLADGQALQDRFGQDFTLMRLDRGAPDTGPFERACAGAGLPLDVIEVDDDAVRSLYGHALVLIRPDHHVAWRGDRLPDDLEGLVGRIAGHPAVAERPRVSVGGSA